MIAPRPPTVTLVPGLGLDAAAWRPTRTALARLSDEAATEVVLLPGYGERIEKGADLRPRSMARLLLDRLGVPGPVVLGGHSNSCQVVAHAAALAPDRVVGLLLVGPTTDPRAASWLRLAARWLATAAHERPGQVPTLARQYHRTTLRSMARVMDVARRDRIEEPLAQVRCPVLVVRGRHDRICPDDFAARLASTAGRGRRTTLPAGGHMVPLTHGELVARAVRELVARARQPE